MSLDTSRLQNEILDDLTVELCNEESFDQRVLEVKIKLAIRDVISRRNYSASSWSDKEILEDLNTYYSTITNIARYDYNQLGAEGESSHSENGVARTYVSRDELFKGVHAFVKVI